MSSRLLNIAVVGHTNTGKTSLVRTLTRNRTFGAVEDRGGTTRQITTTELRSDGRGLIELYDSPGLENAPELIEWLDQQPGDRHAGPARVQALLDDAQASQRFDQEARVLELMLGMDLGVYVIDAREPVLEKYQDELAILALCARPIVPVLNFTAADGSREAHWRKALAEVTLHTVITFDVAVRDPASERRLFEKLKSQLDRFETTLDEWLDVAAARRRADASDIDAISSSLSALQSTVRRREQATVETLLALYRFGAEAYEDEGLPLNDGRWAEDPFDAETLRAYGIQTGKLAGLGAGAGALVDVATGGLSLGVGTVIGTLAGGGAGLVKGLGARAVDRIRDRVTLAIDDPTLALITARQLHLLRSLCQMGHGSPHKVSARDAADRDQALPSLLRRARYRPSWSELNPSAHPSERHAEIEALAGELATRLASQAN